MRLDGLRPIGRVDPDFQVFALCDSEILEAYKSYHWPGNIRELMNELRRFYILDAQYSTANLQISEGSGPGSLANAEKKAILKALKQASGNKTRAAAILRIPRTSLYEKLRRYSIG